MENGFKKCPFCGGEAELKAAVTLCHYFCICKKCGIVTRFYDTEKEAIKAWNSRKDDIQL